jgi:hypothetical protein
MKQGSGSEKLQQQKTPLFNLNLSTAQPSKTDLFPITTEKMNASTILRVSKNAIKDYAYYQAKFQSANVK